MNQLELEENFISKLLENEGHIITAISKTGGGFINYISSKEIKFLTSLVLECFNKYSSTLTEQILVGSLNDKSADEETILKYKYTFKQLKKKVVSDTDFLNIIEQLQNSYISRSLVDTLLQTQSALEQSKDGKATFDLLEKNMFILKSQISSKDITECSTRDISEEIRLYEDMKAHPEKYRGIKVGITKLDEVTGGFRNGELVIVLGETSVGKSIFLMNVQYNTLINNYNSLLVTIEMSKEQARRRLASRISELPYLKIKNGTLTDDEFLKLTSSLKEFEVSNGESIITDVPQECTARMIEAKIRSLMRIKKIDLVILDYLLLMAPSIPSAKMNREERISQIGLELKQMARSLNIPVITASQITSKDAKEKAKKVDEAYDWTDASQAKSIITHADWALSIKKESDVNILNLGLTKGRDGSLKNVIQLVTDYDILKIGNCIDINLDSIAIPLDQISTEDKF